LANLGCRHPLRGASEISKHTTAVSHLRGLLGASQLCRAGEEDVGDSGSCSTVSVADTVRKVRTEYVVNSIKVADMVRILRTKYVVNSITVAETYRKHTQNICFEWRYSS
jgi:hypothetical protein